MTSPGTGNSAVFTAKDKVRTWYNDKMRQIFICWLTYFPIYSLVQWLFFDDDYVEEVPPDKVVTGESLKCSLNISVMSLTTHWCGHIELAYVLFYKRRELTPSNIVNMTL